MLSTAFGCLCIYLWAKLDDMRAERDRCRALLVAAVNYSALPVWLRDEIEEELDLE